MLRDRYEPEDIFARVPQMAQRIDPVLKQLDVLLDDDQLYQQVRADLGKRYRSTWCMGGIPPPSKSFSACCCVSICIHGAIEKPKNASRTAWSCAGSAGCIFERVPDETTLLRWLPYAASRNPPCAE